MTLDELLTLEIIRPDDKAYRTAKLNWDSLAKPLDSMGNFEDILCRIAAIQKNAHPDLSKKALLIMCADNGVVRHGISRAEESVTAEIASLMGERKSSVGVMTGNYPLDIFTYDVGMNTETTPKGVIDKKISKGTADFVTGPAMTREQCMEAVSIGMEAVRECSRKGYGIIATGEMGIGNTTTSTAVWCALTGTGPEEYVGSGAGLADEGLKNKIDVIEKGLQMHVGDKKIASRKDAFEVLRCLGGYDIASLAGVFIGGAIYGVPIVIDGLISAAAALSAEKIVPGCREYMIASHQSRERGMSVILRELSLSAVIHADMALGEGTGAVLLLPMLDMVCSLYISGTSFAKTAIGQYERLGV